MLILHPSELKLPAATRYKNAHPFACFRVPIGTSPELQDLLFGLLRRNAKERMPFDVFFNHPFLQRHPPAPQQQAAGKRAAFDILFMATYIWFSFEQLIYHRPFHNNNNKSNSSSNKSPIMHLIQFHNQHRTTTTSTTSTIM